MKGRGHGSSLPDDNRVGAFGCEHFDTVAEVNNFGCADENHFEGRVAQGGVVRIAGGDMSEEPAFPDGAVDLASVGVAADADVERAEAGLRGILDFFGEQDGARAGSEGGLGVNELLELFESGVAEKLEESAGLAAGDDEAVDLVELLGLLDEHNFRAEFFETAAVSVEVALQGENTDFGRSGHCRSHFNG